MGKKSKTKRNNKGLGYLLRNFNVKHRVSIRDKQGDEEAWYMFISPQRITLALLGALVVMFITVIAIVVYTPVLDTLPINPGRRSRQILTDNIMRLDSLQNELELLQLYSENVALIMEGGIPETAGTAIPGESTAAGRQAVSASAQDSVLRWEIENTERYALSLQAQQTASARVARNTFIPPVDAYITTPFNPVIGNFGIGYRISGPQEVFASQDGTVIMSMWTPSDEYIIQIQHKDNYISIYKQANQLLKSVGDRVEAGEAIAYINQAEAIGSDQRPEFFFELWHDGQAVDPERYLSF